MHTLSANDPLIARLSRAEPVVWRNPDVVPFAQAQADAVLTEQDVCDAAARLARFAPYLAAVFPETRAQNGIIESPLYRADRLKTQLKLSGSLYLKADNELAVSGSIKARGGIYEVLQHAEQLALSAGILSGMDDDYAKLAAEPARAFFSQYRIAVGSTGNLGLSIGIMAAKLGFQAAVHMSHDARQWKKDLLRSCGVQVFEYTGDYGAAVASGRQKAADDPYCHFVDDENSRHLFWGYAVGGLRMKRQLQAAGVAVDAQHPLYVYLPCGVGGGPGGVAFGLKLAFGDHVHCFFAEPTHSPAMLLGLYTGRHEAISVADIGLDNRTEADGLAVGRPSGFVGRALARTINGCYTLPDGELFRLLALVHRLEGFKLEPSAAISLAGAPQFGDGENITHLAWATGGNMVPDDIFSGYLKRGKSA